MCWDASECCHDDELLLRLPPHPTANTRGTNCQHYVSTSQQLQTELYRINNWQVALTNDRSSDQCLDQWPMFWPMLWPMRNVLTNVQPAVKAAARRGGYVLYGYWMLMSLCQMTVINRVSACRVKRPLVIFNIRLTVTIALCLTMH